MPKPETAKHAGKYAVYAAKHGLLVDTEEEMRQDRLRKAAKSRAKVKQKSMNVSAARQLNQIEGE